MSSLPLHSPTHALPPELRTQKSFLCETHFHKTARVVQFWDSFEGMLEPCRAQMSEMDVAEAMFAPEEANCSDY